MRKSLFVSWCLLFHRAEYHFTYFHFVIHIGQILTRVQFCHHYNDKLQCKQCLARTARALIVYGAILRGAVSVQLPEFLLASKRNFMLLLQMFVTVCSFSFTYSVAH